MWKLSLRHWLVVLCFGLSLSSPHVHATWAPVDHGQPTALTDKIPDNDKTYRHSCQCR